MPTFFRPNLPYTNKPLPNDKRFETLSVAKTPPSAVTLDSELNYFADSLNQLQISIDQVAAGAIQGADNPANINKFPITDGASHIDWSRVNTVHLSDQCVTQEKLAPQSVGEEQYEDGSLPATAIANGSLPGTKLADNAITVGKLANVSVTTPKIVDSAITNPKIIDSAITTSKISNNAITNPKIIDSAITTSKISNSAVTRGKLDEDLQISVIWAAGIFKVDGNVATIFNNRRNINTLVLDSTIPQLHKLTITFTTDFNRVIIPSISIQTAPETDPFPTITFDGIGGTGQGGIIIYVKNPPVLYLLYFKGIAL